MRGMGMPRIALPPSQRMGIESMAGPHSVHGARAPVSGCAAPQVYKFLFVRFARPRVCKLVHHGHGEFAAVGARP